jgi:hypothetical protein
MPAPARDLVTGIIQLANLLMRHLAPVFEKAGVTPQQWAILAAMAGAEEPLTLAGLFATYSRSSADLNSDSAVAPSAG